jgi:hypothetical protein
MASGRLGSEKISDEPEIRRKADILDPGLLFRYNPFIR